MPLTIRGLLCAIENLDPETEIRIVQGDKRHPLEYDIDTDIEVASWDGGRCLPADDPENIVFLFTGEKIGYTTWKRCTTDV